MWVPSTARACPLPAARLGKAFPPGGQVGSLSGAELRGLGQRLAKLWGANRGTPAIHWAVGKEGVKVNVSSLEH